MFLYRGEVDGPTEELFWEVCERKQQCVQRVEPIQLCGKHNPMVFFSDTNGGNDSSPANRTASHYAPLQQLKVDWPTTRLRITTGLHPMNDNDMHSMLSAVLRG